MSNQSKKNRGIILKNISPNVFPCDFNESDISMIHTSLNSVNLAQEKQINKKTKLEILNFDFFNENPLISISKNSKNSKNYQKSTNVTVTRSFEEDQDQRTHINSLRNLEPRPQNSMAPIWSITAQPDLNNAKTARNREFTKNYNSNDESEKSGTEGALEHMNSKILDDTFLQTKNFAKMKTEYFNVLIIGQTNLEKFQFIKFCFTNVFNKNVSKIINQNEITEYIHEFTHQNTRKIVTFIHMKGHCKTLPIQKWYRILKEYTLDKMQTYQEFKKLFSHDKRLKKETIIDSRVHLCLHFIQSPKPRLNELIYMKKLQYFMSVLPVIIGRDSENGNSDFLKTMKQSVLREITDCDINILDFKENEFPVRQFRNSLIGKMTPMYINPISSKFNRDSDLSALVKLATFGISTHFNYKTEIIFSNNIDKICGKIDYKKKKNQGETDKNIGVGVGVAIGLGLFGAFVAFKNKLF